MADYYVVPKSALDATADAIKSKTGSSEEIEFTGDGFKDAVDAIPTGGGTIVIASGTITGDGTQTLNIPIGKKMPQTDFVFNVWVTNGTTITPASGTDRSIVILQGIAQKKFVKYDLSTDGTKSAVQQMTYPTVNGNTSDVISRTPQANVSWGSFVRWTAVAAEAMNAITIKRDSSGFTVVLMKNNQYTFQSGITFNWELLYIGSDPTNDIVEVP